MATKLPADALIELGSGLLRVRSINDFFNVVGAWVPSVFQARHHNLIVANPRAGLYLRHFSPGFPTSIFRDYSADAARSDLMLQQAMTMKPGQVMHLAELRRSVEPPAGWSRLDRTFRARSGFEDSIAILLHRDEETDWGAGLVLYRFRDEVTFGLAEVEQASSLAPMLAAGFQNAWSSALHRASREALADIFFNFGNLSFIVSREGIPVLLDEAGGRVLRLLYDSPATPNRLPGELEEYLCELIGLLLANRRMSIVVGESPSASGPLRLYVTPQRDVSGQDDVFLVVAMCDPGFAELSLLEEAGLSPRQVEILCLLQRGLNQPDIARSLGISINTVKYHQREIGARLGATGRSEILSRAIARSIELAIEHGLMRRRTHLSLGAGRPKSDPGQRSRS